MLAGRSRVGRYTRWSSEVVTSNILEIIASGITTERHVVWTKSIADAIVRDDTSAYIELRSTSREDTLLRHECCMDIGHS